MKSRNGKQIRDRFINVLDPDVKKGKFSYKEDKRIKELYLKYGPRWATIARGLPNRTPDMIKNRFHSSIKKYLHQRNFLTRADNKSKNEQSSKKTSELEISDSNKNISNSSSNGNYSNSKSLLDKRFSNNFSNYSGPIQESNFNQSIFDNKYNQLQLSSDFDNRVNYGFNLSSSQNKENKDSIVQSQEFRNHQIEKNFNFAKNVNSKNEFINNDMIFNKIVSKIKSSENNEDVNRTESNSDFSEGHKTYSNLPLRDANNARVNENIGNLFEYPDEHIHNANFVSSNTNDNANICNNIYENSNNIRGYNSNYQQNCNLINNENVISLKNNADFINKTINDKNQNNMMINNNNNNNNGINKLDSQYTHNKIKINEKAKSNLNIGNQMILIDSKLMKMQKIENLNRNNCFNNNNFLKNAREFKIEKTNKISDYNYISKNNTNEILKAQVNYDVMNNKIQNINYNITSNNDYEIKSQINKPNQINFNENSRSTNQVTYPNASSNSSNIHSTEENKNSSPENLKRINSHPYFLNTFEENYQMNFHNYPDSPFRMKSPKYFDFEDFFNNN